MKYLTPQLLFDAADHIQTATGNTDANAVQGSWYSCNAVWKAAFVKHGKEYAAAAMAEYGQVLEDLGVDTSGSLMQHGEDLDGSYCVTGSPTQGVRFMFLEFLAYSLEDA